MSETTQLSDTQKQSLTERGIPESMWNSFVPDTTENLTEDKPKTDVDGFLQASQQINEENGEGDNHLIKEDKKVEGEDEPVSIFDVLNTKYGTEFVPDETKEITERLEDYINHITENKSKKESEKAVAELIDSNPLYKIIAEGYSDQVVDYTSSKLEYEALDITEDTTELNEKLYRQILENKGLDKEEIDDAVDNAKINDKLFDKAKKAKEEIISILDGNIAGQKKVEDEAKVSNETKYTDWVKEVQESLKQPINGIVIPESEQERFANKITTLVDKKRNLTQADIDFYNSSDEDKKTIDWLIDQKLLKEVHKIFSNQTQSTSKLKETVALNDKRIKLDNNKSAGDKKEVKEFTNVKEFMEELARKKVSGI